MTGLLLKGIGLILKLTVIMISYGELNIASVVYYITMSALFVFLTVQAINKEDGADVLIL